MRRFPNTASYWQFGIYLTAKLAQIYESSANMWSPLLITKSEDNRVFLSEIMNVKNIIIALINV